MTKTRRFFLEVFDFLKSAAISLLIVFLMTQFVIKPIRVDGSSMLPTLKDKQVGFSNILSFKLQGVNRFDVVIVFVPEANEHLVKRVIGLPLDTIQFLDDVLYINGVATAQPFIDSEFVKASLGFSHRKLFTDNFGPTTLGEDEYFLMGDNRPASSDSRKFGSFSFSQIVSKDAYIIFPLNEIHWVTN